MNKIDKMSSEQTLFCFGGEMWLREKNRFSELTAFLLSFFSLTVALFSREWQVAYRTEMSTITFTAPASTNLQTYNNWRHTYIHVQSVRRAWNCSRHVSMHSVVCLCFKTLHESLPLVLKTEIMEDKIINWIMVKKGKKMVKEFLN